MPIEVYDRYGVQQDWAWLEREYGPLVIHPANPGPGWRVVEIWENGDPVVVNGIDSPVGAFADYDRRAIEAASVIVVKVLGADGQPAPGMRVAWYWPDAPENRTAGPLNGLPPGMNPGRAFWGDTNGNGDVGFGMGGGAYYWPPNIGPHAVWMFGQATNSDVVLGLGMLGETDHNSVWPVFRWFDEEPQPPPPPPPPADPILAEVARIQAAIDAIVRIVDGDV